MNLPRPLRTGDKVVLRNGTKCTVVSDAEEDLCVMCNTYWYIKTTGMYNGSEHLEDFHMHVEEVIGLTTFEYPIFML
jgi:hypothetical protein